MPVLILIAIGVIFGFSTVLAILGVYLFIALIPLMFILLLSLITDKPKKEVTSGNKE